MKKSKIIKLLIFSFIILAIVGGFLLFKQGYLNKGIASIVSTVKIDIGPNKSVSVGKLIWQAAGFSEEKTYLLLFQNNLELRPSGGYIGNFGILKVENGQTTHLETHDTNAFDRQSTIVTEAPEPFSKYIKVTNWQFRDSNWSPDFATAAQQAEYFYKLQGGSQEFDGVIGINASILPDLLDLTGPIYLEKYDKTFNSSDVLYELEYEVEKAYIERGLAIPDRKAVFKELIMEVLDKLTENNIWQLAGLKDLVLNQLDQKNLVLYFNSPELQQEMSRLGWTGQVDQQTKDDFLMLVEANLGGKKSNYFVKRSIDYFIDFDKEKPQARLKITFTHSGTQNDWFNHDYRSYLRVYVPQGSWLLETNGAKEKTDFVDDLQKTVFGQWIVVPTGTTKTIEFVYNLPDNINPETDYKILIQKQIGVDQLPINISVKKDGQTYAKEKVITEDWRGAIQFKI